MSFKLGTFDTAGVVGLKAILSTLPVLPAEVTLESLPAGDGAIFNRARMTETQWPFALELTANNFADLIAKADTITAALNPKAGMKSFTPEMFPAWTWQGVLAAPIQWERDKVIWFSPSGVCRMNGQAVIVTPDPYGYQDVAPVTLSAAGSLALSGQGNTSYHPRIEFRGVLSATQTLSVGGAVITGPLTAAQTMVLDFDRMDFYIKTTSSGARVRSIADRFTTFKRLEGKGAYAVPISISAGTFTQAAGIVRARRI